MAGFAAFLSVFSTSLLIAIVITGAFSALRRMRRGLYMPALVMVDHKHPVQPPPLPETMFGWIPFLWKLPESVVMRVAGMDALVFVRFSSLCLRYFTYATLISCAIILPVNATGHNGASGMDALSMANISKLSTSLWAHVIVAWVFSLMFFYMVWYEYRSVTELSQAHLAALPIPGVPSASSPLLDYGLKKDYVYPKQQQQQQQPPQNKKQHTVSPALYTIFITNVPEDHQTNEDLVDFFERFFPGRVHSATIVQAISELEALVEARREMEASLDHALGAFKASGERPRHIPAIIPGIPIGIPLSIGADSTVDSIDFYKEKVHDLSESIEKLQASDQHLPYSSAFVSFTSALCAAQATQSWLDNVGWEVQAAPEPRDVFWPNCNLASTRRDMQSNLVSVSIFFLICFWTIPVAFIASLTTLEELQSLLPFIKPAVSSSPVLRGFIVGLLPTLALTLFMSLLPSILTRLSILEGLQSYSAIDKAVVDKMYYFHLINTFLVTTVAGTIFASLDGIIHSPTSIIPLLGTSLPKVSTFFISYIMLNGLASFPLELLRPGPLLSSIAFLRIATSWKERRDAEDPGELAYAMVYPKQLLIFTITITYSVIAPLILPFAVGYFAISYVTWLHQIMYVYRHRYESHGAMWPLLFTRMIIGLLFFQGTLIGVVSLKYGYTQGPLLTPLPILTILFYQHCNKTFTKALEVLPLKVAAAVDEEKRMEEFDFLQGAYVQPALIDKGLMDDIRKEREFENLLDDDDDDIRIVLADDVDFHHQPKSQQS